MWGPSKKPGPGGRRPRDPRAELAVPQTTPEEGVQGLGPQGTPLQPRLEDKFLGRPGQSCHPPRAPETASRKVFC